MSLETPRGVEPFRECRAGDKAGMLARQPRESFLIEDPYIGVRQLQKTLLLEVFEDLVQRRPVHAEHCCERPLGERDVTIEAFTYEQSRNLARQALAE